MFSKELEEIIEAALADGVLTDKERAVLHKRAQAEGVDSDELDVVIEGRLSKMKRTEDWLRPAPPKDLPATEKAGNIIKCPNCGAPVVGGSAVCSECGYAFSNVKANNSAQRLAEKLEAVDVVYREKRSSGSGLISGFMNMTGMDQKNIANEKCNIIRTFPIPNTRADLLEFLASMSAQAESLKNLGRMTDPFAKQLSEAYKSKYLECVNKAKISFANDPDFAQYIPQEKKKGFFGKMFGK